MTNRKLTPTPWHLGDIADAHGPLPTTWVYGEREEGMASGPLVCGSVTLADGALIATAPELLLIAKQHAAECQRCNGTREIHSERCPKCGGSGRGTLGVFACATCAGTGAVEAPSRDCSDCAHVCVVIDLAEAKA